MTGLSKMNNSASSSGVSQELRPPAPQAAGNQTGHPSAVTRRGCTKSPIITERKEKSDFIGAFGTAPIDRDSLWPEGKAPGAIVKSDRAGLQ